jgi:hypothetical protein
MPYQDIFSQDGPFLIVKTPASITAATMTIIALLFSANILRWLAKE